MKRAATAGLVYFACIFGLGIVLGTARVLLIQPRLGDLLATIIELPIVLAASWFTCAWLVRRFAVPSGTGERLFMGCVALVLLVGAEIGLGLTLFGRTLTSQLAAMTSGSGAIGLAGQALFATFPLVRVRA